MLAGSTAGPATGRQATFEPDDDELDEDEPDEELVAVLLFLSPEEPEPEELPESELFDDPDPDESPLDDPEDSLDDELPLLAPSFDALSLFPGPAAATELLRLSVR
jgi:hypothetical protein